MYIDGLGNIDINLQDKIRIICENEFDEFFKYPNVVGVGLGYKEVKDKK